ncbi:MAG: hypothetical protein NDJ89_18050 [Oligoflexia bacterium]|nr:hypothetical protein [Oligoflexia bacterium]
MKKLFSVIGLSAALTALPAHGATAPDAGTANILRRDWNIGGFFNWTRNSGRAAGASETALSTAIEYFVLNGLSAGLALGVEGGSTQETIAALGPGLSWYFWRDGRLAANAGGGVRFGLTDATVNSIAEAQLGVRYFATPSVAFGPSFFFRHFDSRFTDYGRYGVAVNFGVFL